MDRLIFQNLDSDLAERIMASGPIKRVKPAKTKKKPRPAWTYRATWQNVRRAMRADQLATKRAAA